MSAADVLADQQEQGWCYLVPADQCYWAHIDADVPERSLPYRFEASLPLAVEDLYIASTRLSDRSWLCCGMSRIAIEHYLQLDGKQQETWVICPQDIPQTLLPQLPEMDDQERAASLSALNICAFNCATQAQKQWQYIILISIAVCIMLIGIIGIIAGQKRIALAEQDAETYQQAAIDVLGEAFPAAAQNKITLYTELEQSMRRLQQQQKHNTRMDYDYVALAQAMMHAWPVTFHGAIESIQMQGGRLHIRGSSDDIPQAQLLWQALRELDDGSQSWHASPLQAQQQRERVVFQLSLTSRGGA